MLPLQGEQVRPLVRELRSHMPRGQKEEKRKEINNQTKPDLQGAGGVEEYYYFSIQVGILPTSS